MVGWLSKSAASHHFCRNKGKKGHGTLDSGAHGPVPGWWRAVALTLCLATPAGGAFLPSAVASVDEAHGAASFFLARDVGCPAGARVPAAISTGGRILCRPTQAAKWGGR